MLRCRSIARSCSWGAATDVDETTAQPLRDDTSKSSGKAFEIAMIQPANGFGLKSVVVVWILYWIHFNLVGNDFSSNQFGLI